MLNARRPAAFVRTCPPHVWVKHPPRGHIGRSRLHLWTVLGRVSVYCSALCARNRLNRKICQYLFFFVSGKTYKTRNPGAPHKIPTGRRQRPVRDSDRAERTLSPLLPRTQIPRTRRGVNQCNRPKRLQVLGLPSEQLHLPFAQIHRKRARVHQILPLFLSNVSQSIKCICIYVCVCVYIPEKSPHGSCEHWHSLACRLHTRAVACPGGSGTSSGASSDTLGR